jgi:hypothetical protein
MTVFKLKYREQGVHVRVRLFVGPDKDHLALSGELCFRKEEWKEFKKNIWVLFQIPTGKPVSEIEIKTKESSDPWESQWDIVKEEIGVSPEAEDVVRRTCEQAEIKDAEAVGQDGTL